MDSLQKENDYMINLQKLKSETNDSAEKFADKKAQDVSAVTPEEQAKIDADAAEAARSFLKLLKMTEKEYAIL